jgi:hypothetical protein
VTSNDETNADEPHEEYMRFCVIQYKPSIQNAYKIWAESDEDFRAPDYELIVWNYDTHMHLSLNRRGEKWSSTFMGGNELYDFYYSLFEHIEDAPPEITEEVVSFFDKIFGQPLMPMERDSFMAFVA